MRNAYFFELSSSIPDQPLPGCYLGELPDLGYGWEAIWHSSGGRDKQNKDKIVTMSSNFRSRCARMNVNMICLYLCMSSENVNVRLS